MILHLNIINICTANVGPKNLQITRYSHNSDAARRANFSISLYWVDHVLCYCFNLFFCGVRDKLQKFFDSRICLPLFNLIFLLLLWPCVAIFIYQKPLMCLRKLLKQRPALQSHFDTSCEWWEGWGCQPRPPA